MNKLLLILLCLPMIGFGQSWERYISLVDSNSYTSYYGEQTLDGGYIITGTVDDMPSTNSDDRLFLLKLDSQGNTQWNKTYANINGETFGWSVKQTLDSGYIISAQEHKYIDSISTLIIKTNSLGDTLWTQYFDWCWLAEIEQTNDGGYILRSGLLDNNFFLFELLIKLNSQGDTLWTKKPNLGFSYSPGGGYSSQETIKQTTDGGYVYISFFLDTINSSLWPWKTFLNKTDSQGNLLWNTNIYNTSDTNVLATSIEQTTDGGYIVSGFLYAEDSTNYYPGTYQAPFLIKFDSLSNKEWTQIYNCSDISSINGNNLWVGSAEQTNDGGYITLNYHTGDTIGIESCSTNIVLIKTDDLGDTLWTKAIESDSLHIIGHIQQTLDGGYFFVGTFEGRIWKDPAKYIVYLIKTDGNGNVTSTINIPTINTSKGKLIRIVDMLGRETKGKKNEPLLYLYDDGTVEKRIVIE